MSLAQRILVDFPLAGSIGWLRPEEGRDQAVQVRIIQQDMRDRSFLVSELDNKFPREQATASRRVERAQLYATESEAIGFPCKTCHGSGQRPRTRRGQVVKIIDCPTCQGAGRVFP